MTQEDKQLLLKDLCARLLYGVYVDAYSWQKDTPKLLVECVPEYVGEEIVVKGLAGRHSIKEVKPYLRPMSSMTKEEKEELCKLCNSERVLDEETQEYLYTSYYIHFGSKEEDCEEDETAVNPNLNCSPFDWLNARHFDYRIDPSTGKTLIESGLALEAPEYMYKTE